MKLVTNWRKVWRSTTVGLSGLLVILGIVQTQLSAYASILEPKAYANLTILIAIAIGVLRFVQQESLKHDDDKKDGEVPPPDQPTETQ